MSNKQPGRRGKQNFKKKPKSKHLHITVTLQNKEIGNASKVAKTQVHKLYGLTAKKISNVCIRCKHLSAWQWHSGMKSWTRVSHVCSGTVTDPHLELFGGSILVQHIAHLMYIYSYYYYVLNWTRIELFFFLHVTRPAPVKHKPPKMKRFPWASSVKKWRHRYRIPSSLLLIPAAV